MADQFLDIAEGPAGLVDQPSGFGHEGPATGMRRTALEADLPEDRPEPVDNCLGGHRPVPFRTDHGSSLTGATVDACPLEGG